MSNSSGVAMIAAVGDCVVGAGVLGGGGEKRICSGELLAIDLWARNNVTIYSARYGCCEGVNI
jgi:hypothetical protein